MKIKVRDMKIKNTWYRSRVQCGVRSRVERSRVQDKVQGRNIKGPG